MSSLSEKLHIGAIFLIFGVSILGFYLPVFLVRQSIKTQGPKAIQSSTFFLLAKTFSAGVILGVAMLHLLPDGMEDLEGVADYPLGLALLCAGVIATLCMEQIFSHVTGVSHSHHHKSECIVADPAITLDHSHNHNLSSDQCNENCHMQSCSDHNPRKASSDHDHSHDHDHGHAQNYHAFSIEKLESQAPIHQEVEAINAADKAFVKSVVLEVSVAVHSIIVGFGMGLLTSTMTIRVLMLALSFHQFFEGFSLGTVISETVLSQKQKAGFSVVFALTMPVGIIIGMLTSLSTAGATVQGCANALAAGSMLYSCLVEMVAEIFSDDSLRQRPLLKLCMILSFTTGCALLGMLAVWA